MITDYTINANRDTVYSQSQSPDSLLSVKIARSKILYLLHPDHSPFRFEPGSEEFTMQATILHFIQKQRDVTSVAALSRLQSILTVLQSDTPDTQKISHICAIIAEPLIPPQLKRLNQSLAAITNTLAEFTVRHSSITLINNIKSLSSVLETIRVITYLQPEHITTLENLILAVEFRLRIAQMLCDKDLLQDNVSIQKLQNYLLELVEFSCREASLITLDLKTAQLLNNFKQNRSFFNEQDMHTV